MLSRGVAASVLGAMCALSNFPSVYGGPRSYDPRKSQLPSGVRNRRNKRTAAAAQSRKQNRKK